MQTLLTLGATPALKFVPTAAFPAAQTRHEGPPRASLLPWSRGQGPQILDNVGEGQAREDVVSRRSFDASEDPTGKVISARASRGVYFVRRRVASIVCSLQNDATFSDKNATISDATDV